MRKSCPCRWMSIRAYRRTGHLQRTLKTKEVRLTLLTHLRNGARAGETRAPPQGMERLFPRESISADLVAGGIAKIGRISVGANELRGPGAPSSVPPADSPALWKASTSPALAAEKPSVTRLLDGPSPLLGRRTRRAGLSLPYKTAFSPNGPRFWTPKAASAAS